MRLCVGGGHGCAPPKGLVEGEEETAIACYWVTDGIDRCRVGFLMPHLVAHAQRYDGALAKATKVFSADDFECNREERRLFYSKKGCCQATIISSLLLKK